MPVIRVTADFKMYDDEVESFENIADAYHIAISHPSWEASTVYGQIVDHQRVSALQADDLVYPPPIL